MTSLVNVILAFLEDLQEIKMNTFYFWITLVTLSPVFSLATPSKLLTCLALEEQELHLQKDVGPQYFLNQQLLNLLGQSPMGHIKNEVIEDICRHKKNPSQLLLKRTIFEQLNLFTFEKTKDPGKDQQQLEQAKIFIEESFSLFFNYLWSWQKFVNDAKCFEKNIPQYNSIMERYKYLEHTNAKSKLFQKDKVIKDIFKILESPEKLLSTCNS